MARGFARLSPERQREIASKGGKAAHALGRAHEFTSNEARKAGRKGGLTVSKDREYMSMIGKRGGTNRRKRWFTCQCGEHFRYMYKLIAHQKEAGHIKAVSVIVTVPAHTDNGE
jgi:uncharacterized protein